MHTAGFYFTGQVNIESRISAQISQPVDGIIGADILKKYRAVIDYGRNCFYLKG